MMHFDIANPQAAAISRLWSSLRFYQKKVEEVDGYVNKILFYRGYLHKNAKKYLVKKNLS
jgi:hypothetical protein